MCTHGGSHTQRWAWRLRPRLLCTGDLAETKARVRILGTSCARCARLPPPLPLPSRPTLTVVDDVVVARGWGKKKTNGTGRRHSGEDWRRRVRPNQVRAAGGGERGEARRVKDEAHREQQHTPPMRSAGARTRPVCRLAPPPPVTSSLFPCLPRCPILRLPPRCSTRRGQRACIRHATRSRGGGGGDASSAAVLQRAWRGGREQPPAQQPWREEQHADHRRYSGACGNMRAPTHTRTHACAQCSDTREGS